MIRRRWGGDRGGARIRRCVGCGGLWRFGDRVLWYEPRFGTSLSQCVGFIVLSCFLIV